MEERIRASLKQGVLSPVEGGGGELEIEATLRADHGGIDWTGEADS